MFSLAQPTARHNGNMYFEDMHPARFTTNPSRTARYNFLLGFVEVTVLASWC
jgi:hypothetical protein